MGLFQFDYDLTFSVFFLNSNKTIYARYGTRHSHETEDDIAIEGLAETMIHVLQLHEQYPGNMDQLTGLQSLPTTIKVPEQLPSLTRFKANLDYEGPVAKSCIHCHQVRDAQRLQYRTARKKFPEKLMFPFPSIRVLGIELDPKTRATVRRVYDDSAAAKSGIKVGDQLESINSTIVSSEADCQWLLHNLASDQTKLQVDFTRDGRSQQAQIPLNRGWRKSMGLTWRPTSWELFRMATGGMKLEAISDEEKKSLGIDNDKMALRAIHVGMYGQHARAKRAGLRKGDIIVSFDNNDELVSNNALLEHAIQNRKPGDTVKIKYLRDGTIRETQIKLQ